MIRGTDGLDYEDLTAKLLEEPAKTARNERIHSLQSTTHSQKFVREYARIYDAWAQSFDYSDHQEAAAHRAAFQHACIAAAEHDGHPGASARQRGSF